MMNLNAQRILKALAAMFVSFFLFSQDGSAAQVQACKKLKKSSQMAEHHRKSKKKVFCSVRPKTGNIGDYVEIKNKYNYIVAVGRVVKHSRSSSVVVLKKYDRDLGSMSGYPVMLRNDDSQDYWTATTPPF